MGLGEFEKGLEEVDLPFIGSRIKGCYVTTFLLLRDIFSIELSAEIISIVSIERERESIELL